MEVVAFADELLRLLPEFLPSGFKLLCPFGFQRADDVESRLVLKFVKAHRGVLSGHRKSFSAPIRASFSRSLMGYSFLRRFRADSCRGKMRAQWPAAGQAGGY